MSNEPLDEIQWKSPEWIQHFGLHSSNVLDYFAESPFYDRTSNNQVLRMQLQFQSIPPNVHPQKYFQSRLMEMTGIEFVVAYTREPDFWVIRKQNRSGPNHAATINDYYIIGANVYQSPVIYDILSSRLLSSVLSMKKSLSLVNSMASFSIAEGGHIYTDLAEPAQNAKAQSANVNTNTPLSSSNPGTAATVGGGESNMPAMADGVTANDILASAFDSLLGSILTTVSEKSIYLDDIPLYGKGSTVEMLGLRVNLSDDTE
ncbi:hypothetical protein METBISCDRAFT_27446 [Metschnikowia bicuspidata]|uniref:Mediator of RNA polymerase II transcription subunit 6 n=1 Tax=Metschnikowia bicuspidata TaxID=27322 RepID=A0A4P9ZBX9_9ASCO|nr:hypothetical protein METBISCDRAFT_27446 [Metschnikowia bicuspidata]